MCSVRDQSPGSVHMECTQRVHTWGVGGADSKIGSRQGDFGFGWQVQLVRMVCYRSTKSSSGCVCTYVPKMSKKLRTIKYFTSTV